MNWEVVLPLYASGIFWTLAYDTIYAHQVPSLALPPPLSLPLISLHPCPLSLIVLLLAVPFIFIVRHPSTSLPHCT
jgi:hypothetical protein